MHDVTSMLLLSNVILGGRAVQCSMSDLGDEEQTGSYSIYFAEGETLAKQKQFTKAIESFTKVISYVRKIK